MSPQPQHRPHQGRRSRNGCLTCKRRKVRCNEQRPHCYHCARLNLDCVWKDTQSHPHPHAHPQHNSQPSALDRPEPSSAANLFDFAPAATGTDPVADFSLFQNFQDVYLPDFGDFADLDNHRPHSHPHPHPNPNPYPHQVAPRRQSGSESRSQSRSESPPVTNDNNTFDADDVDIDVEDSELLLLHIPPILDPVEDGPKRASVRALLGSMAASSPMVRYSIAAFAAITTPDKRADYRHYYDKASTELAGRFQNPAGTGNGNGNGDGDGVLAGNVGSNELRYVLTTIFFLTYINEFLTGRLDLACLNLAKAHSALQASGKGALGSIEQRIISWIRLSDARAASAGGQGLLVNDTSGIYPSSISTPSSSSTETPPSSSSSYPHFQSNTTTTNTGGVFAPTTNPSSSPHEVIYDMLCGPGIAFFQEVQTITGRITRIAHVHRPRGSVEDETEVMAIAADILRDLASLYARRPPLMDHAVSGNIGGGDDGMDATRDGPLLSTPLASAIVRSFQTYLANFYACYIHLHRVAHRHLARSKAVVTALSRIREMMHFIVNTNNNDSTATSEATSSSSSIPVNMLWPLFLWGSEEDDYEECQWILETMRGLRNVVTNANMTADVLQEIQRRQREAGMRVDIRSVCLELFNATFAII